jgi:peptidoglycan/LPS O-acetylase OafA/YrhL
LTPGESGCLNGPPRHGDETRAPPANRVFRPMQTVRADEPGAFLRRLGAGPTLAQWLGGRDNNLNLLRLTAALLVIFDHQFAMVGGESPPVPFYSGSYGTLGVDIFFVISGFLVTMSYVRSENAVIFLWSRFLRIFPALIVVTCVLVFLWGPLLTTLKIGEYFRHPWTLSYLRGALSLYEVTRYTVLPGVIMDNPIVQVNGALWTLQYEWSFYVLILILGLSNLLQGKIIVLLLFIISMIVTRFAPPTMPNIYWTPSFYFAPFFLYFGFGALAYLYRNLLPMTNQLFAAALITLIASSFVGELDDTLLVFPLGYLVLFLGLNPMIRLSSFTRSGDYSYGLYIWAFPVQQTIVHFLGVGTNVWLQLAASLTAVSLMAIASWHLIEKRSLKLKQFRWGEKAGSRVEQA